MHLDILLCKGRCFHDFPQILGTFLLNFLSFYSKTLSFRCFCRKKTWKADIKNPVSLGLTGSCWCYGQGRPLWG